MSTRKQALVGGAIAVGTLLGLGLLVSGGRRARAPEPAPAAAPPAAAPRRTPGARAQAPGAPAAPTDVVAATLREAPLAPAIHAPALGLELDATTRLDVSLDGQATLFAVDLADGPVPLRRARPLVTDGEAGLFGRGWRSEVESRVVAVDDGALVVRLQGVTAFMPLESDVLVSLVGEVELLRRSASGWELAAADGRLFAFDAEGRLAAIEPGFRVERAPGTLALRAADGCVTLHVAPSGRATRAETGAASLTYAHDAAGQLLAAGERRYATDASGRLLEAHGATLAYDADDRLLRATPADRRASTWTFGPDSARVDGPDGRYVYRQAEDGLVIETPRGEDRVWLDERGRLAAIRRAGQETRVLTRDDLDMPVAAAPALDDELDLAAALGLRLERDAAGRLVQVTTAAGRRWSFGWEQQRLVSTDGPAGPTTFAHDARGRRTSRRDASEREVFHDVGVDEWSSADARGVHQGHGHLPSALDRGAAPLDLLSGSLNIARGLHEREHHRADAHAGEQARRPLDGSGTRRRAVRSQPSKTPHDGRGHHRGRTSTEPVVRDRDSGGRAG